MILSEEFKIKVFLNTGASKLYISKHVRFLVSNLSSRDQKTKDRQLFDKPAYRNHFTDKELISSIGLNVLNL